MITLKRVSDKTILGPEPAHPWEASAVFNCAAIYDNGLVHMIYRATDIASSGKEGKFISRLGYAASMSCFTGENRISGLPIPMI
ncbi:hypothetical protein ES708_07446 [subsurface metagenome]